MILVAHSPHKVAYVTGASTGIGAAYARALGPNYHVKLVARSRGQLEEVAKDLPRSNVVVADLSKPEEVEHLADQIASEDNLEIVVNNAGFGTTGSFEHSDIYRELVEVQVNVSALVRLSHAAVQAFKPHRFGRLVNVASVAAYQAAPYAATYGATKAFVRSFSLSLHEELKDEGILIQVLSPGLTRTGFQERADIDSETIPHLMWMEPEPVVQASLEALERGEAECIPGWLNQALVKASQTMPDSWLASLAGTMMRGMQR